MRNPWSFADFRLGNLFDTGLPSDEFDLVLNWQVINHVGRIKEAFQELNRASCSIVYIINYIYFSDEKFKQLYGDGMDEVEYDNLCWAFNKDSVLTFIKESMGGQIALESE